MGYRVSLLLCEGSWAICCSINIKGELEQSVTVFSSPKSLKTFFSVGVFDLNVTFSIYSHLTLWFFCCKLFKTSLSYSILLMWLTIVRLTFPLQELPTPGSPLIGPLSFLFPLLCFQTQKMTIYDWLFLTKMTRTMSLWLFWCFWYSSYSRFSGACWFSSYLNAIYS